MFAVDPGLAHMGYACVGRYGARLDLAESGHVSTPADWELGDRLRKIWRELATLCRDFRPALFGIENQSNAAIGARAMQLKAAAKGEKAGGFNAFNDAVFEVVGIAKAVAFSYGIPVMLYSPQQAKIAVCGKGSGSAKKPQVMAAVRHYFPGLERDGQKLDEHQADAIAGAIYVERMLFMEARRVRRAG